MAIASINPATGETLREFNALTNGEIEQKLTAAETAFRIHRGTSFVERAAILSAAADLLGAEVEAFARTITLGDGGKPIGVRARRCAMRQRLPIWRAGERERFLKKKRSATAAARSPVR